MRAIPILVLSLALVSSAHAATITVIGGDNIGSDNSTANGNGAITAHGNSNYSPTANLGMPAMQFSTDGTSRLYDFRIIAAVVPDSNSNLTNVDWSQHNWTLSVFSDAAFKNEQMPFISHAFGAEPDNWSGFNRVSSTLNVPDIAAFGNFGTSGDASQNLYNLQFSLLGIQDFEAPLAAGDYFIALQSHTSQTAFGEAGLAITRSPVHPDYWYDTNQILPQAVVPNLTPFTDVGVAFSVRAIAVPEPSSLMLLGLGSCWAVCKRRKRKA
ncbi:PEP-CTERM sorting domain-containing protein [Rubripirellula reticaptiva]|nr:PEP-CTERM sorting domain-containing protein [Rubripirellula reticaptiva]